MNNFLDYKVGAQLNLAQNIETQLLQLHRLFLDLVKVVFQQILFIKLVDQLPTQLEHLI